MAFGTAFVNHRQFERGHSLQHRQKHFIHRVVLFASEGQAFFLERDNYALVGQLLDQCEKVGVVAGNATDFVHYNHVSLANAGQNRFQGWSIGLSPGTLFGKDLIQRQAVKLMGGVLAYRTHANVSNRLTYAHACSLLSNVYVRYMELSGMCLENL